MNDLCYRSCCFGASSQVNSYDPTAIVTVEKLRWAYHNGQRDGVERLAKFVCAHSFMPVEVFEACQAQRFGRLTVSP